MARGRRPPRSGRVPVDQRTTATSTNAVSTTCTRYGRDPGHGDHCASIPATPAPAPNPAVNDNEARRAPTTRPWPASTVNSVTQLVPTVMPKPSATPLSKRPVNKYGRLSKASDKLPRPDATRASSTLRRRP